MEQDKGRFEIQVKGAQEKLLESALSIFTTKGYAATTVREIVEAAGVTKPVLYYYFQNKEGLYLHLLREPFSLFDATLDGLSGKEGTVSDRLHWLADKTFDLVKEHLSVVRLMYAIYFGPPQGAPFFDFDTFHKRFQEAVRRLIQEGIGKNEFRMVPVEETMWILTGAVNIVIEILLCHPEENMNKETLARILDLILMNISKDNTGSKGDRT